jgi:maltose O-acetyltransferase
VNSVEIGARCLVGDHTLILDSDFHHMDAATRNAPNPPTSPVRIESDVWIGSRVTILKGVRIGARSVIAAGAVVTKSIPPDSVAAGIPAKVVRSITNPATNL